LPPLLFDGLLSQVTDDVARKRKPFRRFLSLNRARDDTWQKPGVNEIV